MIGVLTGAGLLGSGLAAGVANAAAGGGTLVAYPALVAIGLPPVLANVTSTAGLLPGYAGSCVGYRAELKANAPLAKRLLPAGIIGGVLGALLLLVTPAGVFKKLVPALVLIACALLALQPRLSAWLKTRRGSKAHSLVLPFATTTVCAVYGSFFGAGLGVVLLAALGTVLTVDLQSVNALKAAVSLLANAAGLAIFIVGTSVAWADAGLLAVGAFIGGRLGSAIARKMSPSLLRNVVLVLGVVITIILAVKTYT